MTPSRFILFLIVPCLLLVGLASSIYLAHLDLELRRPGAENVDSFCAVNERINCVSVASSRFAVFLGIPVAIYGVEFYGISLLLLLAAIPDSRRDIFVTGLTWMAILSIPVSLSLAGISAVKLHVFCPVCCCVYLVNLLLAGVLFFRRGARRRELLKDIPIRFVRAIGKRRASGFAVIFAAAALSSQFFWMPNLFGDSNPEARWQGLPVNGLEIGPSNAPVRIEEFTDFQCPFCSRAHLSLMSCLTEYPGKIRLRHRDYPLDNRCNANISKPFHPKACRAALYARCGGRQGHFWPFSEILFQNQNELGEGSILEYARKAGLDVHKLRSCVEEPDVLPEVKADIEEGRRLQIQGTPTFLVNGELIVGYRPPAFWKGKIESLLQSPRGNPYKNILQE